MASTRSCLCLGLGAVLIVLASCETPEMLARRSTGGTAGPIPTPPAAEIQFSAYTPENPYGLLAPGLLARSMFIAEGEGGLRVEVRDVLLGPGKQAGEIALPGAAVLEVRSGAGTLTVNGQSRKIATGTTVGLSQGQGFSLSNDSAGGLSIRLHVVSIQ